MYACVVNAQEGGLHVSREFDSSERRLIFRDGINPLLLKVDV